MAGSGIKVISDTLSPGIRRFPGAMGKALDGIMVYHAPQVAAYMKNNASWTDRTANARNGLDAKPYRDGTKHGIVAFHQVPYGIWLEVAHNGQYKIIIPTILHEGISVMKTVAQVLSRMEAA